MATLYFKTDFTQYLLKNTNKYTYNISILIHQMYLILVFKFSNFSCHGKFFEICIFFLKVCFNACISKVKFSHGRNVFPLEFQFLHILCLRSEPSVCFSTNIFRKK